MKCLRTYYENDDDDDMHSKRTMESTNYSSLDYRERFPIRVLIRHLFRFSL